jgi:hypothetical protein
MASNGLRATAGPESPGSAMERHKGWLSDFEFRGGRLKVLKTGATAKLDFSVLTEVAIWLVFFACLQVRVAWLMLNGRKGPTIGFKPDQLRPWYLVRSAAAWNGMRVVPAADADIVMFFEDATWSDPLSPPTAKRALNFACNDISKSRVAAVFEATFGYALAIDPATHEGDAVEKSEINSMHDGRVIRCPAESREGYVYQRLIDTSNGGSITDLRTPCVGGIPTLVWEKRRSACNVFSVHNRRVWLRRPGQVFSSDETDAIARFCAAFRLDWGGLDILRDRYDGRIYIVDVNKTDVGPIIALRLWDKLISISLLARALERHASA